MGAIMTPKRRDRANQDLIGTNIKVKNRYDDDGKVITTYYHYIFPNGTSKSLGQDREEAKHLAAILNAKFADVKTQELLTGLIGAAVANPKNPPINQVLDDFNEEVLKKQVLSERSFDEKRIKLDAYKREWGQKTVQTFEVFDLSEFLKGLSYHAYVKHRKLLIDLFQFCTHKGYREDNPALATLPPPMIDQKGKKRKRKRHTWKGYQKIYGIAPDYLQRAMDVALRSLQRRSDLTGIHIPSHLDLKKNTIRILQDKSRNWEKPVYIEIEMGEELREAVRRCVKSDVPCPYLLHYRPKRITKQIRESKLHPFAMTNNFLTKEFAKYRDLSGAYDHLPKEERPTFHSLRAFGIYLYKKAGYPDEYINALDGHADNRMLERYLEGHEDPKPIRVHAGLSTKHKATDE